MGVKYSDIHKYVIDPDTLEEENPEVFNKIRDKEIKNAFKLAPMPTYKPWNQKYRH